MKNLVKLATLLITVVLVIALFGGCNKKPGYSVATNAQFKPFEYTDGSGNIIGLDVDLVNDVAKHAGFTATMKDMEFDAVVPSVQTGASDMGAAGLTITDSRKQNVDFSDPYYISHQEVIVKAGDAMASLTTADQVNAALAGKTIGVCTGFTGVDYVQGSTDEGYVGIANATVKQYDNIGLAITDLKNGQVDAVVMDDIPAKQAASADVNKSAVVVVDVPLTDEEYGIAVKKGNTDLLDKINAAITQFKSDGTLDQLVEKWITNAQ